MKKHQAVLPHFLEGRDFMEQPKGLIFDIQSYSLHDGPGCRTTCFMSGCFLRCEWCANPESWKKTNQLMFAQTKCRRSKGCSVCRNSCPKGSIGFENEDIISLDWEKCRDCTTFECTEACYHEALRKTGKWYTVEDIMKLLSRDRQFWGGKGGVTFSGGEPLVQRDFLLQLLKECRESYIHTALETTAYLETQSFLEVMQYVDFAFIDVKHMDREKHKEKTGVYNDLILSNIEALKASGWKGRIVLRMPVIKGYNDTDENILKTAEFMDRLGLYEINILPFHRLGDSKWNQLGQKYVYSEEEGTSEEKLDYIQNLFLDRRIACYVGHQTTF